MLIGNTIFPSFCTIQWNGIILCVANYCSVIWKIIIIFYNECACACALTHCISTLISLWYYNYTYIFILLCIITRNKTYYFREYSMSAQCSYINHANQLLNGYKKVANITRARCEPRYSAWFNAHLFLNYIFFSAHSLTRLLKTYLENNCNQPIKYSN